MLICLERNANLKECMRLKMQKIDNAFPNLTIPYSIRDARRNPLQNAPFYLRCPKIQPILIQLLSCLVQQL